MIEGILYLLASLVLLILGLCAAEVLLRLFDRFSKSAQERRREQRVLDEIGRHEVSIFHRRQAE